MNGTAKIDSMDYTISSRSENQIALHFAGNKNIFFLPVRLSESFSDLRELDAENCSLTVILKENFKKLDNLEVVLLRLNQIERIETNTFEDLSFLKYLWLSENPIKVMSGQMFNNHQWLEHVDLKETKCIDESFEDEASLKTLSQVVDEKCGLEVNLHCVKSSFVRSLVLGGSVIRPGQWPFLVALQYRQDRKFFCGGNLITSRHVLTGES